MTDEEAMELIDAVIDDVIDNPEVYYRWDYENESNLYFISIRDDYLVLRDYMVTFDMILDIFYLNQHVFHNNRVVKFNALRSFMSHGREDFDDRNFFVFHEGEIFVVNIADKSVARYEPLDVSELPPTIRLEKLKMPTDEEFSLLAYDIDKADYEEMSYSELSTLEELGPELILLSGEIIDYNDFYLDYSEAVLQMEENGENHKVILRFFYSPLEPLEVGDQVEVYGKLTNNANILAEDRDQLAVLVQWIEVLQ